MIDVSRVAQQYLVKTLINQKQGTQVRIFVNNPGTIYAECGMCFYLPESPSSDDIIIRLDLLSIYVNQFHVPFIKDAKVDIVTNALGSKLTIQAPNMKEINDCKLGNSSNFSLEDRIRDVLHFRINPQLAQHGGKVSLIQVTDDFLAIIQFHGGCNGCSMAHYTIKEGIETTLRKIFPELTGVSDATQHQYGDHSYY